MANTKMQDRLERMREKMAKHHSSTSNISYWKPQKDKKTRVRILPPVGNMELFYQEKGIHTIGKNDDKFVCPNFTTNEEQPCPICEAAMIIENSGDKELAKDFKVRRSYHMNILVRDDSDGDKIYVYTPGIKVFEQLAGIINEIDFGDITDAYTGNDLSIVRKGDGLDTEYQVLARPQKTPIFTDADGNADEAKIQELLDTLTKTSDLSRIKSNLLDYDELLEKSGVAEILSDFNEEESDTNSENDENWDN